MAQEKREWNVVVTVREGGFRQARAVLPKYGMVRKTDFYNVLVMQVADVHRFLEELAEDMKREPDVYGFVGHVSPLTSKFTFQSAAEFEDHAAEFARSVAPQAAGKRFHVRMHRRGFKGRLSSQHEERFLDHVLLDTLASKGQSAAVDFEDPDAVIVVETVGQRAGLALWTKEDLQRFNFLNPN